MYSILVNTSPTKTALFYNVGEKGKTTRINREQFVASLSQDRDSLAMWKYYSKGIQYDGRNIGLFLTKEITNSLGDTIFSGKEVLLDYILWYIKEKNKKN